MSVLRQLWEAGNGVPALILSARGAPEERVKGLNQGADDYLAKPFHLDELVVRVHVLLRRSRGQVEPVLQAGCLELAMLDREVRVDGETIELTTREFALLACLMGSPGRVFARTQLCERVWNYHHDPGTNVAELRDITEKLLLLAGADAGICR